VRTIKSPSRICQIIFLSLFSSLSFLPREAISTAAQSPNAPSPFCSTFLLSDPLTFKRPEQLFMLFLLVPFFASPQTPTSNLWIIAALCSQLRSAFPIFRLVETSSSSTLRPSEHGKLVTEQIDDPRFPILASFFFFRSTLHSAQSPILASYGLFFFIRTPRLRRVLRPTGNPPLSEGFPFLFYAAIPFAWQIPPLHRFAIPPLRLWDFFSWFLLNRSSDYSPSLPNIVEIPDAIP